MYRVSLVANSTQRNRILQTRWESGIRIYNYDETGTNRKTSKRMVEA